MKGLKENVKRRSFKKKKVMKSLLETKFFESYFATSDPILKEMISKAHKGAEDDEINFVCRRMNKKYLRSMFRADNFRKDFFDYLANSFLPSYKKNVERKIETFLKLKVDCLFDDKKPDEANLKRICREIQLNSKWKIPWTYKEAENAAKTFEVEYGPDGIYSRSG